MTTEELKPGQKFPTPTPGFGDRVFYETLLRQRPDSVMAQEWFVLSSLVGLNCAQRQLLCCCCCCCCYVRCCLLTNTRMLFLLCSSSSLGARTVSCLLERANHNTKTPQHNTNQVRQLRGVTARRSQAAVPSCDGTQSPGAPRRGRSRIALSRQKESRQKGQDIKRRSLRCGHGGIEWWGWNWSSDVVVLSITTIPIVTVQVYRQPTML